MNKSTSWFMSAVCGAALAFGLSFEGAATAADQTATATMEQKVINAKSKADHEDLAAQYEAEAKDLQGRSNNHRKMALAYSKNGFLEVKHGLVTHCNRLADKYAEAAKEATELAKEERELAKKAKQ